MDELSLYRNFRRGVAAPSEDARRRASAQLTRAIEGQQGAGTRVLRPIKERPGRTVLAFATLGVATAVALFVSTPWQSPPGFLEQVQAALTPPEGTILHQRWELTTTSTDPACTVTYGRNATWIDQTPPHRYRALLDVPLPNPANLDPRKLACARGTLSELGGRIGNVATLWFTPPNTLSFSSLVFMPPQLDPVKDLRAALSAGSAEDEGPMELDGRIVERIRMDPPCIRPCSRVPSYSYVDPETFHPVQLEGNGYIRKVPGGPVIRRHFVIRTKIYEYLPRTAANLALTDIYAQHPNATRRSWP